jgi:hypothetical protein
MSKVGLTVRAWVIVAFVILAIALAVFVTPYHVVVHKLPNLSAIDRERHLVGVTALATAFLGAATVWLGWETRRLGEEEAKDRRLGIRPVLVFDHVQMADVASSATRVVRNVGEGPALKCRYISIAYLGNQHPAVMVVSRRFTLCSGQNSNSGQGDMAADAGQRDRGLMFFGYRADGHDLVEKARGSQLFREVVICEDVLGTHWWFVREGAEGAYSFGEGHMPGTDPTALVGLP